jgi:hypothetical protein
MYWSKAGIYYLASNQGIVSAKNISETTIQSLFTSLPKAAKEYATGHYDAINRQVSWLYSSSLDYTGVNYKFNYDTELVLDTTLEAFTRNTISSLEGSTPYVAGYLTTPDLISAATLGSSSTKYLTLFYEAGSSIPNVTFSHYRDRGFLDWKSFNGVGRYFNSYLLTGYELGGTSMVNKQAPYIIVHCKRTENNVVAVGVDGAVEYDNPSSCLLQSRWDFSDSVTSGKWGSPVQVYRLNRTMVLPVAGEPLDYGFSVVTTKNRLTGRGKALSLLFSSFEDNDMHILGWATKYTSGTVV